MQLVTALNIVKTKIVKWLKPSSAVVLYHCSWCGETVIQSLHCIWKNPETFPQTSFFFPLKVPKIEECFVSCVYGITLCPPFPCWIKAAYILSSIFWIDKSFWFFILFSLFIGVFVRFNCPSPCTLCTFDLYYRSIHLFGKSVFCATGAPWNTTGRRCLTG